MSRRAPHTLAALALTVATAITTIAASPASARPADQPQASPTTSGVSAITDQVAQDLAAAMARPAIQKRVVKAALTGVVDLANVEPRSTFARGAATANHAVLTAKGLPASSGSLLQLRLATPGMENSLRRGAAPLVAAAPTDDTSADVIAYRPSGGALALDAARAPHRPVILVEVNTDKALRIGLKLMRETWDSHGLASATQDGPTASAGYWATRVDAIRLNDDHEPWAKGSAEIFNLVGGFGHDGKVRIDTVQMPYLDNDGTTYYPGQLVVHFFQYKYNLADIVMMEDDGGTNYQQLAVAIATALLTIVDGGAYIPLVTPILNAIPGDWWTDDPDYADSWYTLATWSSGRLYGASGNGWMDVSPYWVPEL